MSLRSLSHIKHFQDGRLQRIRSLHPMSLRRVLEHQYGWSASRAKDFAAFLMPMLRMDPNERATAAECLKDEGARRSTKEHEG